MVREEKIHDLSAEIETIRIQRNLFQSEESTRLFADDKAEESAKALNFTISIKWLKQIQLWCVHTYFNSIL